MSIPDYRSIMLPILQLASDGAEHQAQRHDSEVVKTFELTDEELAQLYPSGSPHHVFSHRVRWAITYLKKAGLIASPARGRFQVTEEGRQLLAQKPATIDLAILKQYPAFLDFHGGAKHDSSAPLVSDEDNENDGGTPEEHIASAHATLRKLVQAELLAKLITASSNFFERLVVDLLTAMGYDGSLPDAGQVLGRPHDGGIDGVIKEDKLGLDLIYLQAKRWKDTTVGSGDVQSFVGALAGVKARRGIFITTSKLSQEAIKYAQALENRIILIDGERLTELMFEYDLGVAMVNSYKVKRVDSDFFESEDSIVADT